ncbi:secreted immunoglobulin domain 4 [Denticeps clupeoides]|uniref:secreted immunoglobulin domain 4 n=1 Tax=Denticeps clupeoides TaxID=299321 RepID=UPI0010A59692|nr:basement membrane-specific heparan sulfate proteoglycan core protein-like [Denticeps clupeoides]
MMRAYRAGLLLLGLLHTARSQAPTLSIEPHVAAVQPGETASFRCRVVHGAQPVQLQWKRTNNLPLGDNVKVGPDGSVLTVTSVQNGDQGAYRCIATNPHGKATVTASLNIKQAPKVRVSPAAGMMKVTAGETMSLACHASGKPRPTITWYRVEGSRETPLVATATTDSRAQYQVASASPEHAGTYVCRAQSREGSAEARVQVEVGGGAGLPPRASVSVEEIAAVMGQEVSMHCQATGSPAPVTSWSKLRAPLPWLHKVEGGTLTLSNVGRQDSGQYICNATNSVGYSEAYVQVEVEAPPYTTILNEQVTAVAGETVRLQCLAHGSHPIEFGWSRVGGAPMPAHAKSTKDGYLLIGPLRQSDGGTYKCVASNRVGSSDARARVTVRG